MLMHNQVTRTTKEEAQQVLRRVLKGGGGIVWSN